MTTRPAAFRFGDHPALDFLNSVAAPRGETIEWLASGQDLLTWMTAAGLLDAADAAALAAKWSSRTLDRTANEAVELREWLRTLVRRIKDQGIAAVRAADTKRLNELLARDSMYARIGRVEGVAEPELSDCRHWTEPSQLIAPVAGAVADLICSSDWDLVRKCENPACTMWFYDRTKGHRRRWCSQSMCGNRAKVAAFRERQRHGE